MISFFCYKILFKETTDPNVSILVRILVYNLCLEFITKLIFKILILICSASLCLKLKFKLPQDS